MDPSCIVLSISQSQKFTGGPFAAQSTTSFSGKETTWIEAEELAGVFSRDSHLTRVQSPKYSDALQLVDLMKTQRKDTLKLGMGTWRVK